MSHITERVLRARFAQAECLRSRGNWSENRSRSIFSSFGHYKSRKFRAHRDAKLEIGYSLRSPPEIRRGSAAQRHGGGL